LRDHFGTTIFMTTHDMEEADDLCEIIAIMHRGVVVTTGSPASLKAEAGGDASLDDVFIRHAGGIVDEAGGYVESPDSGELLVYATARLYPSVLS
jgi:ABC-2 type transport system ATP-binding protein